MAMTDEQKARKLAEQEALRAMMERFNGCPLFAGREKGALDDITGQELTISDLYQLQDYHCVVFEELPNKFFLTGGALKELCNEFAPEFVIGRVVKLKEKVKTNDKRREYRPIEIIA